MSCSTAAAHSSSRSTASPACRPAPASSSKRPSARRAARDNMALTAERGDLAQGLAGRCEVARRAADRDKPVPRARDPVLGLDPVHDVLAQRLAVIAEALGHPDRAELPGLLLPRE